MKLWRVLAPLLVLLLLSCTSTGTAVAPAARTATSLEEHAKLGLSATTVEPWEDGARTTGGRGTYEWWYFDCKLDDGSTLVIVFLTKNFTQPQARLTPTVTLALDRPDGSTMARSVTAPASAYSSSRDRCYVRIGACRATGDLHEYFVHYEDEEVRADLRLQGTVPAWRPGTGHAVFGRQRERYFAWLPSVPQGAVSGTITLSGQTRSVSGVGYHDHNWGNAPLTRLVHHWYWGRAQIGDYTVIASDITATRKYGGVAMPVFMLARGSNLIAEDAAKVRFSALEEFTDPNTGKPVAGRIVYEYEDGEVHYRITFRRFSDLLAVRFADIVPGFQGFLARLLCFDGAYLRFAGTATLERFEGVDVVETVSQESAVWELMYFGSDRVH